MALLTYSHQGESHEFILPREKGVPTYLRANKGHPWLLSLDEKEQEYSAQLVRADNGFYVLIPRMQKDTDVKVNNISAFGLRVLRNADNIQIGQEEIRFYEWVLQVLTSDSQLVGTKCPFCTTPFTTGDQVMLCPKCDTSLHDYCWVSRKGLNEGCVLPNCGFVAPEEEPYVSNGESDFQIGANIEYGTPGYFRVRNRSL